MGDPDSCSALCYVALTKALDGRKLKVLALYYGNADYELYSLRKSSQNIVITSHWIVTNSGGNVTFITISSNVKLL